MDLDDELCLCFHVTKRKVVNFLRLRQPRVPSQLAQCGSAGTGCGWCIPFLKKLFERHAAGEVEGAESPSAAEYAKQRGAYLRAGKGTPPPGAAKPPPEEV